ncbi:ERF family protein [Lentilactobacillus parabuchneri]|uniref:ERF family protein n=1 Tax=Lentilactobacillus parabuchneri TaxID=152331 RepID=UPI002307748B|nr:ERF family protein [Lentilactobacillus parabuchneri]MDB1104773.1 ERF family protein [Lentilactobacillus parabuchneri]
MKTSESIKNIAVALSDFRKKMKQPAKDKKNPFFKSNYVALEGVQKSIDEALPDGLTYTQEVVSTDNGVSVSTIILHKSGEYMQFDPLAIPAQKQDPQGYGSAETYARRYSLSAAFGISSDIDDDGNQASQPAQQRQHSRPTQARRASTQARPQAKQKTMSAADKKKLALEELITKNAKDMMTTPKDLLIKVIKQAKVKSWKNATVADIDAMNHELQTEIMEQKQQAKKDEAKTPDEQFDELGI